MCSSDLEKIDGIMEQLLDHPVSQEVLDNVVRFVVMVIKQLCKDNLIHGDLHWENFGYRWVLTPNGGLTVQPILIDFGSSASAPCNPKLEVLQLLRTLDPEMPGKFNESNAAYIHDLLHKIYVKSYGRLTKSFDTYDRLYSKILDKHYEMYG